MKSRILAILGLCAACVVLLAFGAWFDFLCDDAFISFRFAENWVAHGEIVYNLGERVEGYTSVAWVALLAALHALGCSLPVAAKLLGGASGVLLILCAALYARRLLPGRPLLAAAIPALVASNACIAAWTLGGLETPLFAALVLASVMAVWTWLEHETPRHAGLAAAVLVMATLTRPEGALLFGCVLVALAAATLRSKHVARGTVVFVLGYVAACTVYLLWRRAYYGMWLPNTFYVKVAGVGEVLPARGRAYLAFAAEELGIGFVLIVLALALLPGYGRRQESQAKRVTCDAARLFVLFTLAYLMRVGGDFLDLFRFLVPVLPLVFGLAIHNATSLVAKLDARRRPPWLVAGVGIAAFAWYAYHQSGLANRAMQFHEPRRASLEIETIATTGAVARRWAATGRWLAAHAKPGDLLAVGAAGALPFFSGLPNLDTLGLCDSYVARHGVVSGSRPGHQRHAPMDYVLGRRATFIFIYDYYSAEPRPFQPVPAWGRADYRWIEARLLPRLHGADAELFHYFLVRKDRAAALAGQPLARLSEP